MSRLLRRPLRAFLFLLPCLLACAVPRAFGAEPEPSRRSAVPDWVDWIPLPPRPEAAQGGDRVALLADDQISLLGAEPHRFYRRATWVARASGIGRAGDFTVEFDPAFERVELHGVWVERDGRREDRLDSARVETLRRESGLESGLLDGRLTLHLVLENIRVGDVVDLAVSVHGDNPALAGRFRQHYWFAPDLPTLRREVRLLQPRDREVTAIAQGEAIEHRREERDGRIDRRWTLRDLAPAANEERVPAAHFDGAQLELADAARWRDVVDWALPLYRHGDEAAVAALAAELGLDRANSIEAAILAAIRFVQDEVRYTGLELGAHAFRPYPPSEVARRRYGDCKDKALLLVALLRHLGLEAHPALVDIDEREAIAERLPGPQVFDHVIVRFEHAGREHWVDATAEQQRGDLAHRVAPPYGKALLVAAGEDGLRTIPATVLDAPRIDIRETIDLRDAEGGLAADGDYRITTTYRGASADSLRRRFANASAEEIGKGYVEAVATYYPGVRQAEAPGFVDDPVRNEFTVEERYVLPGHWRERGDGEPGSQADFWLSEIDRALAVPKAVERRNPWHLGDAVDVRQRLEVLLDTGWPADRAEHAIRNAHFSYEGEVVNRGDAFMMSGRLRSSSEVVPAAEVEALRKDLLQLSDDVSYALLLGGEETVDGSPMSDARLGVLGAALLLLWGWIAYCGASRSLAPAVGILFRPRATVRAGIDAHRQGLAFALIAAGGVVGILIDEKWLRAWDEGRTFLLIVLPVAAAVGTLIGTVVYVLLLAWLGRRLGGQGRSDDVLVAAGWSQLPILMLLPIVLVLLASYGPGVLLDPSGAGAVPWVFTLLLGLLPMFGWAVVVWFAALAEAHRYSVGRAILTTLVLMAAIIGLVVLVVFALR